MELEQIFWNARRNVHDKTFSSNGKLTRLQKLSLKILFYFIFNFIFAILLRVLNALEDSKTQIDSRPSANS